MITNDCNGDMVHTLARVYFLGVDLLGQTESILNMLLIYINRFPLEDYRSTNTHFPLFLWPKHLTLPMAWVGRCESVGLRSVSL